MSDSLQTITLGGGCFWCTEAVFVDVRGITDVESGYCNGHVPNVTYQQVCTGTTGHNEVVKLVFDPAQISLRGIAAASIFSVRSIRTLPMALLPRSPGKARLTAPSLLK